MADLVVGMAKSLVDGALTKAQAAIEEEGKLRQSAARNLVFITGEFQMIQSFLKVADSDRLENPVGRTWVRQIRDLAYDVEDCIEFVVHLDRKNRWWLRLLEPMKWITSCVCVELPPLPLDQAIDELDRLKARVDDVSSRNTRYSLIGDSGSKLSPAATTNDEEQLPREAAGAARAFNRLFEAAFRTTHKGRQWDLTQLLPKEDHDLQVISIWATATATGVGGGDLGMASIAWNAYTDRETRNNFTCRAWVKVMHPFDPHDFVRSLASQFYASLSCKEEGAIPVGVQVLMKMEAARGGEDLKDFARLLTENRFLVVLEDLHTMAEWESIRGFFPDMKNGSCVILSTQHFEVASLSVGHPYQVLHLNQLSDDHSVYAFFTKGSQYDANGGTKTNNSPASNNGVAIVTNKKEEAKKWMEEHPLVGRESEMKDLGLSVVTARYKKYQVMSVWGIAGVGKPALVKNMFCDRIVNGKLFQKYGWVDVAHPFNLWDFSRVLLSNFSSAYLQTSETAELCTMGSRNPIVECREIMKKHKCLVVIDGLQSKKEWDLIHAELVSRSNLQNVVVAVTTDAEIATHCRGDKEELVFNVKGLEADTALELFKQSQPGLDIVAQQAYSHVQSPISSPVRTRRDWDLLANENHQAIPPEVASTNTEHDNVGRTSPPSSNQVTSNVQAQGAERRAVRFNFESKDQNPSFKDLVKSDVSEILEGSETQISQEPAAEWGPEGPPDSASVLDEGNLPYPFLPTVLEEPSSSFSEAAEDDPLPAIDGLRITGEAFPGREIQASGYSINGTTSCNFEWVRHLEDGSVNYIEGAKQPTYLVTADDVDSLLAIEVQPLDDRKRKGEIVKVYANEQRKITCDPEMKELIKKILSIGHVSYEVLLPVRFIDMWEPAVLAIKREGYSIKCNGQRGVVITEKFQQATAINIPYGRPIEFSIQSADGAEYNLKPADSSPSRDSIVLILRLFRMKAVEKSKGRKKGIFFK